MLVKDYTIVFATRPHDLANKVMGKITEGYQPFGNMVLKNGAFYQPMVKYSS